MQMQVRVRVQVQVQRLRDSTVSLAGGSTAAKTVAKGPLAFQEQNCPGWMREMSSPIMLPPVATSEAPLTCAQSDEALLIAPKPRTSMPHHHRRCTMSALNVMTTTQVKASRSVTKSPRQALSSIAISIQTALHFRDNQTLSALSLTWPRSWARAAPPWPSNARLPP